MPLADQIVGVGVIVLGASVGVLALILPARDVIGGITKYLKKLFAGPVKTEPFAQKRDSKS